MQRIFKQILADHPAIRFEAADGFVWSPSDATVRYIARAVNSEVGLWSLLHEIGHSILQHQTYRDDLELLMMEVAAWKQAKQLAPKYQLAIDQDHIDECIRTYRDWLHTRSTCVECTTISLQTDLTTYKCHNCGTTWSVPASRMCLPRKTRLKI